MKKNENRGKKDMQPASVCHAGAGNAAGRSLGE